jgi:hypothetical protein
VKLSSASSDEIRSLLKDVRARVDDRRSLASAAQALADALYGPLEDSLALVRVFATVPFKDLPGAYQGFARSSMRTRRIENLLSPATPVLALMGTRGARPDWNDRMLSHGHLGIPLASAELVHEMPMIARLLSELGLAVEGVAEGGARIVRSRVGNLSAMFYVEDAATERDEEGRPVIAAQDFVTELGVRTVCGFGGAYLLERSHVAVILFATEAIEADRARELAPVSSALKAATMRLVDQGKYF